MTGLKPQSRQPRAAGGGDRPHDPPAGLPQPPRLGPPLPSLALPCPLLPCLLRHGHPREPPADRRADARQLARPGRPRQPRLVSHPPGRHPQRGGRERRQPGLHAVARTSLPTSLVLRSFWRPLRARQARARLARAAGEARACVSRLAGGRSDAHHARAHARAFLCLALCWLNIRTRPSPLAPVCSPPQRVVVGQTAMTTGCGASRLAWPTSLPEHQGPRLTVPLWALFPPYSPPLHLPARDVASRLQNPALLSLLSQNLDGDHSLALPPAIRRRVQGLKGVQAEHAKIESEFQLEILALEKKVRPRLLLPAPARASRRISTGWLG